ncbi:MAG TPA: hypothetical protein VMV00_01400 [Candidatus Baltobacteraceae bacterium]|nr:hypothetical protein [Candidatus Baltobacteraceae bacterium]
MVAKEDRCIICGEPRRGLRVKEDYQIRAIRWFKKSILRNEKGYGLVVCKECYPKYKKAKDSYNRKQGIYIGIGVLFAFALGIFSGGNILPAILYGGIVIVFMYALSQISYMPDVITAAQPKKNEPKKRA